MKKQDILSPIGLLLGMGLTVFGILNGGGKISSFVDVSSIAITIGGSFGALLLTFTMDDITYIPKALKTCFTSKYIYKADLVDQFKEISRIVRKEGVLAIEREVENVEDPFLRKGLELVIDGVVDEDVKEILEIEMSSVEEKYDKGSRLFKVWGSYAPAFGMIGTLIGLIQMLVDMGGSADVIATGMSKALITTFYGALMANLILNPIGLNIEYKGKKDIENMEMMICGISSIQNGDGTRIIEEKLVTFLNDKEKKYYYNRDGNGEDIDVA